ncbi:protein of unknown function [Desulfotomaculum arcticum]|uniref:Uncharacterized protein n=1 Tax=Desulfotruncus arcticus DSM 17038 TaxID=1121424 RepID=A0A1I2V332_9FIRM|nr:DUF4304 domain-containing protein [Desulfotruncus arcticus]SFG83824.1 protein of unknown function [Desulfotomaculum arcticum] [Desulfotruncus arcticus DSM 17038]
MLHPKRKMTEAIIDWVVPFLKDRGFSGFFPNYRRMRSCCLELISFQFSCCDQSFCVNIGKCPPEGIRYKTGEFVGPSAVTALHCPVRFYLGVQNDDSCHWFKYNPRKQELKLKDCCSFITMYKDTPLKYTHIADDIVALIVNQADSWWENSEAWWEKELPVYNKMFMDFYEAFLRYNSAGSIWKAANSGFVGNNDPKKSRALVLVE